jgi:hypothetical protein
MGLWSKFVKIRKILAIITEERIRINTPIKNETGNMI